MLLEVIEESKVRNRRNIEYLDKGDIVKARFSKFGVKLLFGNVWSFDFSYEDVSQIFKVHNQ